MAKTITARRHFFVFNVFQEKQEIEAATNFNVRYFLNEMLTSKYNILHLNINSLKNKLDELEQFLHGFQEQGKEIHILAVTQIEIHQEVTKYYNLPDYTSHFSTNSNGAGGVALFIHKSLVSGVVENLERDNMNCLIANIPALNINIGVLYKDPNTSIDILSEYLNSILQENQRTIFVGNMNVNLLTSNASIRRYMHIIKSHKFAILNKIERDFATFENSSINAHVLANVRKFQYSFSLCDTSISNHKITLLGFDDNKQNKVPFIAESNVTYRTVNYREFNMNFSRVNLNRINSVDYLVSQMDKCKYRSLETKTRYLPNRDKHWISAKSLRKSDRMRMRSEANARNINACKGDSRKLWDTINECLTNNTSSKHSIDAIQNRYRQIEDNKEVIADIFNSYFLNIGKILHKRIPRMDNCSIPEVDFNENFIAYISTNGQEVQNIIQMMKKANCIYDSAPSNTLKYYARRLAPLLARLFNDSFSTGEFPESLKIDRIVPVFKSKDPMLPKNYRPISVPPNLSKVMEFIITDRITHFCHHHNIIDENQFGFQKNSSAMSAVISVVDYLQVELNSHPDSIEACLFIDLKKASNTIPHDLLMTKLHRIGIRGPLYALLKSYLHHRRHVVNIDNVISKVVINRNSVSIPQGSAFGPLMFLLYINDIFKLELHGKVILYADDIAIVYVESDQDTLKRQMQNDLKLLNKWFSLNCLTMNTTKTKIMIFNAGNIDLELNLKIRNEQIEIVKTHKYLGIELQSNLKWDVHIDKIVKEIRAASSIVSKKIGNQLDHDISFGMYQKMAYNRLSSMASIYGAGASEKQLEILQAVQNMAVNSFFSGNNVNNINEIYAKYKLLNVKQIIKYDSVLLIYKLMNNCLKLNRTVSNINDKNILSVAAKHFESVHPSIRNQRELSRFKSKFKASYFNH